MSEPLTQQKRRLADDWILRVTDNEDGGRHLAFVDDGAYFGVELNADEVVWLAAALSHNKTD